MPPSAPRQSWRAPCARLKPWKKPATRAESHQRSAPAARTSTPTSPWAARTDVRPLVERAARHGVLDPPELLAVKDTLISARNLARNFERAAAQYPNAGRDRRGLPAPGRGDRRHLARHFRARRGPGQASDKLARIRREMKIAYDRLMSRLERMVNDPKAAPMLQEALITQRNGRYVIPLRAEFKGQMRSIVHDQSSSGATLFVEPLAVVELNNEWHSLQLAERDEERRILAELSDLVGDNAERINLHGASPGASSTWP